MKLRDMGLRPKILIAACQEAGIKMSSKRASEILNGQSVIHEDEMEVIAKLLNRTVEKMYMELGSSIDVICPIITAGMQKEFICVRQRCAVWDWDMQECSIKVNNLRIN
jgi:hypothetical protein